jgi:uncharacterized protein YjiK
MSWYAILLSIGIGLYTATGIVYDFSNPEVVELPKELHEISGLTIVNDTTFAAIQDEQGIIYLLDTLGNIKKQIPFAGPGDFEGIAVVENDFYTLRSDGKLFRVQHWHNQRTLHVDSFETHIQNINNEGFCYDKKNHLLLIGSKSKRSKSTADKNLRTIYSYNIDSQQLDTTRTIEMNIQEIMNFASTHQIDLHQIPSKKDPLKMQPNLKIQISGMYIHPVTNDLYVLSAGDYYLFILDEQRKMKSIYALPARLYNKSEGIVICKNGQLVISNEGQQNKPTLLKIKP